MSTTFSMPFLGVAQASHQFVIETYRLYGLKRAVQVAEHCFPTMPADERAAMGRGTLSPLFSLDGDTIEGGAFIKEEA